MTISMLSNHPTLEVVLGFKLSVTLIHYAPALSEQLPTMLLSESTGYKFFLTWILRVHAITILSNRGDIYYTSAKDLMGIGIPEETCCLIL